MHGILLVDKPHGWTSFDVVAKIRVLIRSQTGQKKCKVGHTGTLDPLATGLMVVLVGSYCKQAGMYTALDKTYESTIRLGYHSTTGDEEGTKTVVDDSKKPSKEEITDALYHMIGEQLQTPPQYSAVKINGVPAYKRARIGKVSKLTPKRITVYDLTLKTYHYPDVAIHCRVSSGTYIRVLAEDIGSRLKTGAYVTTLRRTAVGKHVIDDANTIDDLKTDVASCLFET